MQSLARIIADRQLPREAKLGYGLLTKDVAQLLVSATAPFVAAGAALWIASLQRRERLSCFISYGGQYGDTSFLGMHNRSGQTVAITSIRYLAGGPWRTLRRGTALDYEDPSDLRFPYKIAAGEILKLEIDEHQAKMLAETVTGWRLLTLKLFRRSRVLIECQSSAGARYRTSAEPALPWDYQLR